MTLTIARALRNWRTSENSTQRIQTSSSISSFGLSKTRNLQRSFSLIQIWLEISKLLGNQPSLTLIRRILSCVDTTSTVRNCCLLRKSKSKVLFDASLISFSWAKLCQDSPTCFQFSSYNSWLHGFRNALSKVQD